MTLHNLQIGKTGEEIACDFLYKKGFQIIEKNYYCHWGEIDVIAKKNDKIHFVEIKTRVGTRKGEPYESVNRQKLRKLMRAIQFYLLNRRLKNYKLCLDVISIVLNSQGLVNKFNYFENTSL